MTKELTAAEMRFVELLMTYEDCFRPDISELGGDSIETNNNWQKKYAKAKRAVLDEFEIVAAERDALVAMLANQFYASALLALGGKPTTYALQRRILALAGTDSADPQAIALRHVMAELKGRP